MWLKGSGFQILQGEAGIFLVFQKYRKFFCTRDPEFAAGMEHYSPANFLHLNASHEALLPPKMQVALIAFGLEIMSGPFSESGV